MVSGSLSYQRRFVGKEHEWSVRPHSNYYVYEERYRFPGFGHFYCPDQLPPVLDVSKHIIWWVAIAFGPSSPSWLRAPHPYTSLILALVALPPSPTVHHDSAQAIDSEADHPSICGYRLLSFPVCQLRSHTIALSHCLPTYADDTLNPPCIIASTTRIDIQSSPVSVTIGS